MKNEPTVNLFRGPGYCLLLYAIIAAFVALLIYGHRLAIWIDSWGAK
jgi:hypothetical protein